jgi:hypothetical protein
MDEIWELLIEGHKCACRHIDGSVHVTISGKGFYATKTCPAGSDARAAARKLCEEIVAERTQRR